MKRQDGRFYRSDRESAYSIDEIDFRLPVGAQTVTVVDGKSKFTNTSFHKASTESRRCYFPLASYVLTDVTCIDQEDERIKAAKIGNQAAVFNFASRAYVWLSRLNETELQACNEFIFDHSGKPPSRI